MARLLCGNAQMYLFRINCLLCFLKLPSRLSYLPGLLEFIFSDLRSRQDLVFAWLYQEYSNCQGYSTASPGGRSSLQGATVGSYSNCLTSVLAQLIETDDHHADMYEQMDFTNFFLL